MTFPSFENEYHLPGERLLPHRAPFLFVDELIAADKTGALAKVTFGPDQYFFKGHFPEYPVVPGVILVETMAQAAGAGLVAARLFGDTVPLFFLAAVDQVRFRRQVRPGDTFVTVAENTKVGSRLGVFTLKGYVGDELAAEAVVKCMLGAAGAAKGAAPAA